MQLVECPQWCLRLQRRGKIPRRDHQMTHWSHPTLHKYPQNGYARVHMQQVVSLGTGVWLTRVWRDPPGGCLWTLPRDRASEWQLLVVLYRLPCGGISERSQDGKNSQRQLHPEKGEIFGLRAEPDDEQVPQPRGREGGSSRWRPCAACLPELLGQGASCTTWRASTLRGEEQGSQSGQIPKITGDCNDKKKKHEGKLLKVDSKRQRGAVRENE